MTVTVRLPDGGADEYMRFGDAYVKNTDGTLDVVRTGSSRGSGPTWKATNASTGKPASGTDVRPAGRRFGRIQPAQFRDTEMDRLTTTGTRSKSWSPRRP